MSSTQAVTELQIPADRVEKALMTGAFPGFHGNITVMLSIQPTAVQGVVVVAYRNTSIRAGKPGPELVRATEAHTPRENKVREWIDVIRPNLVLRTKIVKIVAHFRDGECDTCEISEQ